ncbi:unnamed protein product [Larinioides sclopetarius]|uniref:Uncharacterized protein n=1 Tax=Larinioides sclopetarius TaxID=280406 RepID=A0AAV2BZ07_9ARAC
MDFRFTTEYINEIYTCGSVNYFRTPAQTINPGPQGEPPVFGTSVSSTTPVYNFKGIPLPDLKNQPKELRVEHSAVNRKIDITTGVMETDASTQQIGVLCAPSEFNSTFPLRGNQSKPLFGTSGIKRGSETTGNNEESALVALVSVPVDADQQSSKLT